ncbi:sensor histidine kinase [Marivita sp. S0852]|uniref:sensor histidine kinase n=1 Tax=Marivita sp. S0852 TaxID=3373893 RepID=UPI0039822645
MTARVWGGRLVLSLGTVGIFLVMLFALGPVHEAPPGAVVIDQVTSCDGLVPDGPCDGPAVTLPLLGEIETKLRVRAVVPVPDVDDAGPLALYFPRFADGLDVYLDGALILRTAPEGGPYWHWSAPSHVRIPQEMVTGPGVTLDIIIHSAPLFPPMLAPFQFGPDRVLSQSFEHRARLTVDVAWFGLLLALLCTIGLSVLAVVRRRDRVYHWAAFAGAATTVLSLHYLGQNPPVPDAVWMVIWTATVPFLVASLHRFIRRFLRRRTDTAERVTLGYAVVALIVMALTPEPYLLIMSALVQCGMLGITFYLLSILIRDRRFTTPGRFATLYGAASLTAALATHDAMFLYLSPPPVDMQLGQFMPLVFMFVTGWLVVVQLVTALARQEALSDRMRGRIIERTRALRQTARQLEASEREALLAQERQRIMMDLHDGVGGHLANALAGLRQSPLPDLHLREVLEEAQTDLGLMVDSLYNPGDVVSLLGALRARIEPMLERQGVVFDWQVEETPRLPNPTPTSNINLLRIVQEFITNVLKHADADCITVITGRSHILLKDDGKGFDVAAAQGQGHGLRSQARRAGAIGARLTLESDAEGSRLFLGWGS